MGAWGCQCGLASSSHHHARHTRAHGYGSSAAAKKVRFAYEFYDLMGVALLEARELVVARVGRRLKVYQDRELGARAAVFRHRMASIRRGVPPSRLGTMT